MNLVLRESSDPFIIGKDKLLDRLNIEALENTIFLRIKATHITDALEKRVEEMMKLLVKRIKIPDSPN
jgi:predicted YcjX-like family ATPase